MLLAITVAPLMAHSAETTIRLTVGFERIGQKLAEQVYTEAGNARVWRESDCRYLSLDSPAFSHQDGRLRFTTHGAGSFGAEVLETCVAPFAWKGYIESLIEPFIGSDWQLRFRVRDSDLYDEAWSKGLVSGLLWEVTERFFLPRLGALSIDLAPPRTQGQGDPVRRVFAETWRRLHRIVEEGAERGLRCCAMRHSSVPGMC